MPVKFSKKAFSAWAFLPANPAEVMGISSLLHLFPAQVYWLINLSSDFEEKEILVNTWNLVKASV